MALSIFDSRDPACKQPFGAVKAGESVTLTVHLPKTAPAGTVQLRIFPIDHWEESVLHSMELCGTSPTANSYRCTFLCDTPAVYLYHFELHDGDRMLPIKQSHERIGVLGEGDLWQLTVYSSEITTPACLQEGVMYQIFPDRFFNSGHPKTGVPKDRLLRDDWGGLPHWRPNADGEVTNSDYFCGDLDGIQEKLEYLSGLGVTVIYLNPIFEAHSNHRYNTADYHKIDPLLGTNEDFMRLCAAAKAYGISIILDGVFSHTGSDSIYFNKEKRYGDKGAYNDPDSPYRSWFQFTDYPHHYESWWGFQTLPNTNETDPAFLDFICGDTGVLQHWLRLGASGFRLDVADELPDPFLDRLYESVKAGDPDAAIIGEVWEDASNKVSYGVRRRYLLGGQLDSVMNYPFKDSLLHYIRHGGGYQFYNTIMGILENYPPPVIPALMNSLSTHDTARAITLLGGAPMDDNGREWQESHHKLGSEQYRRGKQLFLLASIIQFGLPGIPCIYYGDEAGMCGYKDPFNRVCYPWGKEDSQLVDAIAQLGAIRKNYPIFSQASFAPLLFDDDICAFIRSDGRQNLLFAINRGPRDREIPFEEYQQGQPLFQYGLCEPSMLGAYSGVVLYWERNLGF